MPRFVLGPKVGVLTFTGTVPTDPGSRADQAVAFVGMNPTGTEAVFDLGAADGSEPIAAIHLVFVRPPVPEGSDAGYFLAGDFELTKSVVPLLTPTVGHVSVPIPPEVLRLGGTWEGQTVLEYAA